MNSFFVLSALLFALGIGGALSRANYIMILVSLQSGVLGVVLAICAAGVTSEKVKAPAQAFAMIVLFAFCMVSSMAYVLFFSRFKATKRSDINAGIELRQ